MFAQKKQAVAASIVQRTEQELSGEMHLQLVRMSNALAYHGALAARHKELVAMMFDKRIPVLSTTPAPIPCVLVPSCTIHLTSLRTAPRASSSTNNAHGRSSRATPRPSGSRAGN